MNFELTEDQKMIREAVRDFAEREIRPVAQELDEKAEFSVELTKKNGRTWFVWYVPPRKIRRTRHGYARLYNCC